MNRVFSGSCEAAREELDAGEEDPGLGGLDGRLEVLGQPPVSIEPGERALDVSVRSGRGISAGVSIRPGRF